MEKFIMADGCAVRVSEAGSGERTVVLLHGYLETLEVWEEFTPLLAPSVRVVAIDLPGHGISETKGEVHTMAFVADVVAGALQALGVEKCCLVGHSMGGYVALEFLRRHEAMLAGLVLMNSTPNPDSEAKREARAREVEAVLAGKKGLFAEEAVRGRFAPQNRRRFAGRIEELTALAELCDDEGIAALLRGMASREDTNAVMTRSAVPQLFILGADDDYINPGVVDKLREGHPAARFVVLENVGHMAMVEAPEAAAAALLEFAK